MDVVEHSKSTFLTLAKLWLFSLEHNINTFKENNPGGTWEQHYE